MISEFKNPEGFAAVCPCPTLLMATFDYDAEIAFTSSAPGYWADRGVSDEDWSDHKWQLKNRVQNLAQLEEHLTLSEEERAGVLLTGTKLASAVFSPNGDSILTKPFKLVVPNHHMTSPLRKKNGGTI